MIVPDLRGHGDTPLGHRRFTVEQLADDAFVLLDALGINRAAVCGVSLGGMVALEMADRSTHRVASVVLSNTPTSLTTLVWLGAGGVRRLARRPGPLYRSLVMDSWLKSSVRKFIADR